MNLQNPLVKEKASEQQGLECEFGADRRPLLDPRALEGVVPYWKFVAGEIVRMD
jgi:hypothetical protein